MSNDYEKYKKIFLKNRIEFENSIIRALTQTRDEGIIKILQNVLSSLDERPPTSREKMLIDVLNGVKIQSPVVNAALSKQPNCIRCGVNASLIYTIIMGFACCGSCWSYLSTLDNFINIMQTTIDVDVDIEQLVAIDESVGFIDGIEI
jgi:hypothetical protein